jgi:HD-like signal output (HDOD) protein
MSVAPTTVAPLARETLVSVASTLPADLRVLSKLAEILRDPNSELDDIATLLRRDVALAARIVRISNSAAYGGSRSVSSIEEAVNRVGFGEVLKLVGTATAGRLSESALVCYDISAKLLRDNMLYAAFAAEALARPAGIDPRVAYNAGLVRAVGMMVLDRVGRRDAASTPLYSSGRWPEYGEWEASVFGVTSSEVTALVLNEWGFPVELTAAARSHYLTESSAFQQPLAALLNVANGLARHVCRTFRGEEARWDITPEKLSAAGVTEDDFGPAVVATEAAFDAANAALAG